MVPGDLVLGRYEIVERVVTGATTTVYRGRDCVLGEDVAIKVMRGATDDAVKRFQVEALVLRKLSHPNLARFIDFAETPLELYLITRWVDGPSLRRQLDTTGLTLAQAVAMGRQVASALGGAHERGVIHRDIKPGNILWSNASWIVIDFGVARMLTRNFNLTRTGAVVGTFGYMAPEQAGAERNVDVRADLFALGCVLYEAIGGRPAFESSSSLALEAKLLVADPPAIEELVPAMPVALAGLITDCMAKAPTDRPPNAGVVVRALASIEEAGLPELPARPVRRRELPTLPASTQPILSIVITSPLAEATPIDRWEQQVRAALVPFGGTTVVLGSGAVVYRAPSESSIEAAAGAALALHAEAPDLQIAIASARDSVQIAPSLEAAGTAIDRVTIDSLFSDTTSRGIRLDTMTAGHLGREFNVITIDDVCYLSGRRP